MSYKNDYEFGINQESKILDIIKSHFKDDNVIKTIERYSKYDFIGNNIYELKSRNNKYDAYPTTLITNDKIINTDKDLYFIFNFIDGVYYIKYDEIKFKNYLTTKFVRKQRIDYKDREQLHIFVPIVDLIRIC